MKKALSIFVAFTVACTGLLAGCGGGQQTASDQPLPTPPTRPAPTRLPTVVALPTPDCNGAFFEETKRTVCQPFLDFWNQNGGLAIFGFPITDLIQEKDRASGEVYKAQYFERARFELHEATGNQVVLGRLGALLQRAEGKVEPKEGAHYFPETGHNVSGPFLKFWQERGGLAIFGFPITEERIEINPTDKKEYLVQYFERARFEHHPDHAGTPFEVQLTQLGTQLYKKTYRR